MVRTFLLPACFFVCVLVLSLVGESSLRWVFMAALAAAFLAAEKKLDFSWVKRWPLIAGGWGVLFGLLLVSLLNTHSVPLSLQALSFWLFAFLVFVAAIAGDWTVFKKKQLAPLLLVAGCGLSLASFYLLFHQAPGQLLPGMNLLYATFGHNHLAALLLLIMPLAWREVFLAQDRLSKIRALGMLLILSGALIFSFGRVAIFLGVVEAAVIWWAVKKNVFFPAVHSRRRWVRGGVALLVGALVLKGALGSSLGTRFNFECAQDWWGQRVCKPWSKELRPLYFAQALRAVQDFPLGGYGPGTFELVNRKYTQLPFALTSYTHNHFLQVAAEMGVPAGLVFMALMGFLYWRAGWMAFSVVSKTRRTLTLDQALWIGSAASGLNALVDFDWSYLLIFSLTLFFLGIILSTTGRRARPSTGLPLIFARFTRAAAVGLLVLSLMWLCIRALLVVRQPAVAFALFPYFADQAASFREAPLSDAQNQRLAEIYRFHPEALTSRPADIFQVSPWENASLETIRALLEQGNFEAADQNLTSLITLVETADRRFSYHLGYTRLLEIAQLRLDIADYFLQHDRPEAAAEYYLWAQLVEPWILDHRLPAVTDEIPINQLATFIQKTGESPQEWGQHAPTLFSWHVAVFMDVLERGDIHLMEDWFSLTDTRFENTTETLWTRGSASLLQTLTRARAVGNENLVQEQQALWQRLWEMTRASYEQKGRVFTELPPRPPAP